MDARARLAWNVRHLRSTRGLSQETLAVDSRVAAPYLSGIERGVVNPTIDVLDRLAAVLGVEVDTLLRSYDESSEAPRPLRAGRKPKGGRSQSILKIG
ncbi:helix-turn-helix transcriptional regulator [Methylobacterium sp. E-045]|uniref:helix-turn-helix domain-containing protein n=1 Tax=Methylobacterium sp. E-045 TaxID=2836575 RepID=UPI002443EBDF|nr:helix-turn-helix transcriptional regulator [Methylobacterium sp. E-045]MCJ2127578.1 helix-turn-helix domain-containing protein [Methylobacterium sp. E-045]